MLYLTETRRDGDYSTDNVLFTSQTNAVDIRFTSDFSVRRSGASIDIRSISCTDRDNFPQILVNTATTDGYIPTTGSE